MMCVDMYARAGVSMCWVMMCVHMYALVCVNVQYVSHGVYGYQDNTRAP